MDGKCEVKSWGDEKASLQLEIDFMMRRRNQEDEEGKRGRKEENKRFTNAPKAERRSCPHGHRWVIYSTHTLTRKVDMTETFHMRVYYERGAYYPLRAWTKENLVLLGVSLLVLGL